MKRGKRAISSIRNRRKISRKSYGPRPIVTHSTTRRHLASEQNYYPLLHQIRPDDIELSHSSTRALLKNRPPSDWQGSIISRRRALQKCGQYPTGNLQRHTCGKKAKRQKEHRGELRRTQRTQPPHLRIHRPSPKGKVREMFRAAEWDSTNI